MFLLAILIAGLAKAAKPSSSTSTTKVAAQLVASAKARLRAAQQDADPTQKLVDAAEGLQFVNVARLLVTSDRDLESLTHTNISDLQAMLATERESAFGKTA